MEQRIKQLEQRVTNLEKEATAVTVAPIKIKITPVCDPLELTKKISLDLQKQSFDSF